jgi:hypothetical protein
MYLIRSFIIKTSIQKCMLVLIFFSLNLKCFSQKEDNIWFTGYEGGNSDGTLDTGSYTFFGISKLDFSGDTLQINRTRKGVNFDFTNSTICDSLGNIILLTNGTKIYGRDNKMIENGDSLMYGFITENYAPSTKEYGFLTPQGAITIKKPGSKNSYYVFYTFIDTTPDFNFHQYGKELRFAEVDMDANNGKGRVIIKEKAVIADSIGICFSACRHANGRDWWLVTQEINSNCFYKLLVDPTGVFKISKDCEGWVQNLNLRFCPASCFSPKGDQFAYINRTDGLYVFDFDRCLGTLSNRGNIRIKEINDSSFSMLSVAYSESGRFLYVSVGIRIFQYDMWASDIQSTRYTIGEYDNFIDTINKWIPSPALYTMQLAPNGKIYLGTGNAAPYFHIIEEPEKPKDSCMFKQRGLRLPTLSIGVSNFPYFRLGKANDGCGADVIEVKVKNEKLKIFPNPASDFIYLKMDDDISTIEISNILGQIQKTKFEKENNLIKIDLNILIDGTYFIRGFDRDHNEVFSDKVLKH